MGGNSFKCQCGSPVIISEGGTSVIMNGQGGKLVIIKGGRLVIRCFYNSITVFIAGHLSSAVET